MTAGEVITWPGNEEVVGTVTSAILRTWSFTTPAMRRWKGDIVSFPTVPGAYLSAPRSPRASCDGSLMYAY